MSTYEESAPAGTSAEMSRDDLDQAIAKREAAKEARARQILKELDSLGFMFVVKADIGPGGVLIVHPSLVKKG